MKSNSSVTIQSNDYDALPPKQQRFLYKILKINQNNHSPVCFEDFPEMTNNNFRVMVLRLKQYLEPVGKGRPQFWKIKGFELPLESRRVTFRYTGEAMELIQQLEMLKDQPGRIHDIKLKVNCRIHYNIQKNGCTVNSDNHSILVNIPVSDNSINIKALVYPKIIQIDVGCSFGSIIYDIDSLQYLLEILTEASIYLSGLSKQKLPPVKDWVITHYHFNKDGNFEINGKSFHFTFGTVTASLIRFYSKKMKDGRTIPRIEKIVTPRISFSQAMIDAIGD